MSNKQCPRCLRHRHEEFLDKDKKTKKRFIIDRCAHCHYNFDIRRWDGSYIDTEDDI